MNRAVVILIGPPTSGKGTQALWLENEQGFVHLESTAVIRKYFADHPDDPVTKEQREKIARGAIVDPPLILRWMKEAILELARAGKSIVLSGSPRSRFEAEGDESEPGLYPLFEELYGPENIHNVYLDVTEKEAIRRSLARRVCAAKGHPIPDLPQYRNLMTCPWDGSPLQRRTDGLDDDEKVIRKRYREYVERIQGVMDYLRERGYETLELDGDDAIEAIHHHIVELIERRQRPAPRG